MFVRYRPNGQNVWTGNSSARDSSMNAGQADILTITDRLIELVPQAWNSEV